MELDKYIESALSGVLKNPVSALLREIGMARLLRQSNFTKRSVGFAPYENGGKIVLQKPSQRAPQRQPSSPWQLFAPQEQASRT